MTRARELADLLTGGQTISTADNTAQLTLESTDTDASVGPVLNLSRDNSSAADNDLVGEVQFNADDDGNNQTTYGKILTVIEDASNGSEDGLMQIHTNVAGTLRDRIKITSSEMVLNEESIDSDFRVESNGNANMLFVDAGNDRVAIGETAPLGTLHVRTSDASLTSVTTNADDLILENNGNCGMSICSSTSGAGNINFIDSGDTNIGRIQYTHSDNKMGFRVNDTDVFFVEGDRITVRTAPAAGVNGVDLRASDSSGGRIRIAASGTGGYHVMQFFNTNGQVGSIGTSGTSTSFNTSSDHRLKQGVEDMTGAIDRVKALAPKRFQFIADADTTLDGFLAHEAQAVVPEAVTGTKDETREVTNVVLSSDGKLLAQDVLKADWTAGKLETTDDDGNAVDALYPSDSTWSASHDEPVMQGIDQAKLVPLLTGALQEAIAEIETLKTKVAALEAGE